MAQRVSVFVDGANLFYMQRDDLRWFVDPCKLLAYIESNYGNIADAFYYIGQGIPPEVKQELFLKALPRMGYSLVTKPIKTIFDAKTKTQKQKANLDIEIVLDMFNTIDNYDLAVLVSGDGDFTRALDLLKARGKKVIVIASSKFMASELQKMVGRHWVHLEDLKSSVKKDEEKKD
uniref:LabA-like NYN domain-containing protein n=1 Tax=Alistipes sp. Marseille-P5061 TaxID=2048242 RepID=UPI000D0ED9C6|nr:NYN domain-containing protein [Alistipes sp. Marseille-P5061]